MKPWLKYLLVVAFGLLFVVSGMVFYAYSNLEQLKQLALKQFGQVLKSEVTAANIEVDIFKTFPRVSLQLRNVKISEPLDKKMTLLKAANIYFGFNIYDLLDKNYAIKYIRIDSGYCNIRINKNGTSNFDILKENKERSSDNFSLNLKKVEVSDVLFNYTDFEHQQFYEAHIYHAATSGNFTESDFDIKANLDAFIFNFKAAKLNLLSNKKISLSTTISASLKNDRYTIKDAQLIVEQLKLSVSGGIVLGDKKDDLDFTFLAEKISIQQLLGLLPFELPESFKDYESNGKVYFSGLIRGENSDKVNPEIKIEFGVENGSLSEKKNDFALKNLSFIGSYSNGKQRNSKTSLLSLKKVHATLNNESIDGELTIENFTKPRLNANCKGSMDINQIIKVSDYNEIIKSASGNLTFDFYLKGDLNEKQAISWRDPENRGNFGLKVDNVQLTQNNKEFKKIDVSLVLKGGDVEVDKMSFNLNSSDVELKGKMDNFVGYILGRDNLNISLTAVSNNINIEDFLFAGSDKKQTSQEGLEKESKITVKSDFKVKKLVYDKFIANNFSALVSYSDNELLIDKINLKTMEGNLEGSSKINFHKGNSYLSGTAKIDNINIKQLFSELNNFGQSEFTDKHIDGRMSATSDFAVVWDKDFNCLLDKIYLFSDVSIKNGQIVGYKPLESLSKFAKVDDLRNLKFSDLKNQIEIKNKTINLPAMEIFSNAINLTLSGTHTFENYIDYRIKVRLSELLKKNRKVNPSEEGEEDEKTGGLNLFLHMYGPIDNIKFSYDKLSVKKKITADIKTEKENIKEIFRKELGFPAKTDSATKKNQVPKNNDDEDFEPN